MMISIVQGKWKTWLAAGGIFMAAFALLTVGIHAALGGKAFGTDIYMFWLAGRAVFIEGRSPYAPDLVSFSQLGVYGRLAYPGEDILAFSYPPYSLLPVAPISGLSFDWAQAVWLAFSIVALLSAAFLILPQAPRWIPLSMLAAYPFTVGLILGNYVILLGAILLVMYWALSNPRAPSAAAQVCLGIVLSWYTIKPQFVWLFVGLLLFHALRERLWSLVAGFGAGLAGMLAVSFWMDATWPVEWLDRLKMYTNELHVGTPTFQHILDSLLPSGGASLIFWLLSLVCLIFTIWLLWQYWHKKLDLLQALAWSGLVIYGFHPRSIITYEQLIYWVPLVIWVLLEARRQPKIVLPVWLGMLAVTWGVFVIGKFYWPNLPAWLNQAAFLLYIPWTIWLLSKTNLLPEGGNSALR